MNLLGDKAVVTGAGADRLFEAGVSYLACGAYSLGYACFDRLADDDLRVVYNKAMCCFGAGDYERCYSLLCEADRLLPVRPCSAPSALPQSLLDWEHESALPLCPMLVTPFSPETDTLFLRLKAEAAFRLRRYDEVRAIAARLGGRYRHICNLIEQIDHDSQSHL